MSEPRSGNPYGGGEGDWKKLGKDKLYDDGDASDEPEGSEEEDGDDKDDGEEVDDEDEE